MKSILLLTLALTVPLAAGEPLAIEDRNFMPESGWNRTGAALQVNGFVLDDGTAAHELGFEWGSASGSHQFSGVVAAFSNGRNGIGDTALSYRYQLLGGPAWGVSPRVTLLLPTRSDWLGEDSSGLQVNLPLSASVSPRLTVHSGIGLTWFRNDDRELNLTERVELAAGSRLAGFLDASYKRSSRGEGLFVVRPGVQCAFSLPGGGKVAPGIALPAGGGESGVLLFVAFEQASGR